MIKKNIIWIILDGVRNYATPNDPEKMGKPKVIDELAPDGVEFSEVTTSATSTIMSITAMMTAVPAYYLSRNLSDIKLDKSNFESVANILEAHGYNVYSVCISYEMRRDYWETFLRPVDKKYWPPGYKTMKHWGNEPLNEIIFKMLDQGALEEPFLLYVHYNFRRDYNCNQRVADLITRLKSDDLYEDSILVMNSDHGMPDSERRDYFKWLDERGLYFNRHDLIMTDDNILVPLVIKYPDCEMGLKVSTPVGTIDIAPTLLDLVGIEFGEGTSYGTSFRGNSLLPLMKGESDVAFQDLKYRTDTRYIAQTDRITSIRGAGYKYINYRDVPGEDNEVFIDLTIDKFETNNLIDSDDDNYCRLIADYKLEFQQQEEDSIVYQQEYLTRKFKSKISKHVLEKDFVKNVLVLGSCNYWFMTIIMDILRETFGDNINADLFLERTNIIQYNNLNQLGYTNNIFAHHSFNALEFRKDYLSTFPKYDLVLIPLTDYKKDIEQSESKSTDGKMVMIQPQAPISSSLLSDYKDIFKITSLVKADVKVYCDYNMNLFRRPRLSIVKRYMSKMLAKRDIYVHKPVELYRDIKRLLKRK